MTNTRFYSATEDDRAWDTDRADTLDEASQAAADALQTSTQGTNPIDTIVATPATVALDAATTSTIHTAQVSVSGQVGTVANSAGFSVTYASSSTGKATVSETGLITGVGAGTATITVTAVHDTAATDTVVATVS